MLRHRNHTFLGSVADTPFLRCASSNSKRVKQNVKNAGDCDRKDWAEQQRENKTFSERGEIYLRSDRDQATADNCAGQRVSRGNRKTRERGEDDGQSGARCNREDKIF